MNKLIAARSLPAVASIKPAVPFLEDWRSQLPTRAAAKVGALLCLSLGLILTVWLVIASNATSIFEGFTAIGWGAAIIVLVRAATIATNGLAWTQLTFHLIQVPPYVFMLLRWIREAINALLPVASIGGEVAAARALTFWRAPGALAISTIVADLFLQVTAQAIFALLGACLLANVLGTSTVLPGILLGTAAAAIGLGGFYLVHRYGGGRLIDRAILFVSRRMAKGERSAAPAVQKAVETVWHGRQSQIAIALLIHLIAWMIGTLEVLTALHFMGWPITVANAVILESLGSSISSAAFFIPGSWGAQEAGYVFVGHMLGVPMPVALALSLVKRVPDFVLGAPGLLAWYWLEARRLVKAPAHS